MVRHYSLMRLVIRIQVIWWGDVNDNLSDKKIYTLTGIKSQKLKRGVNLVRRGKRFVKIVQP